MPIPLDPNIGDSMTFQRYDPQPEIAGVWMRGLRKHRALEGDFLEVLRCTGGVIEESPEAFEPRQVSCSWATPGRVNAFHLHPKVAQDEVWCVLSGVLLVWLVDVRADSPTRGNRRRVVLSAEEPALLHIPAGVAHGYRAGKAGALLLYAMNQQFDPADPNEGRLPWDYWGAGLWEDDRG